MELRNRMIQRLEEADSECACEERAPLLTFVVAGGGFAGVETIAGMNDFLRAALPWYGNVRAGDLKLVLVHPGEVILPELGPELGRYAQTKLAERGVEIRTGVRVTGVRADAVELSDQSVVTTKNLVWTAGTAPNPLLATLPIPKERGRVKVEATLAVPGFAGVWALGDAAAVPDGNGSFHPPTAQHALREARTLARNLAASLRGKALVPFRFTTLGQLAAIGRRTGVARVFGLRFSGFFAWWLWRTIYLSKLPRLEKKLRCMLDWTLDLCFSKDLVQYLGTERGAAARLVPRRPEVAAAGRPEALARLPEA
jgi:NADH dehydrogenase